MLKLKPFHINDAKSILSWIKNEEEFIRWSAGRFKDYPISTDELITFYKSQENTEIFVAEDDNFIIGQIVFIRESKEKIKLGMIIIDSSKRGKGYAKKMLNLAKTKAKEMGAKLVYLTVFEDNLSAIKCYESIGFKNIGCEKNLIINNKTYPVFDMGTEL